MGQNIFHSSRQQWLNEPESLSCVVLGVGREEVGREPESESLSSSRTLCGAAADEVCQHNGAVGEGGGQVLRATACMQSLTQGLLSKRGADAGRRLGAPAALRLPLPAP